MRKLAAAESFILHRDMVTRGQLQELETALGAMLPAQVGVGVANAGEVPGTDFEVETALLKAGAVGRRNEFSAGRVCARAALARLGVPAGPIGRDADGLPLWPSGSIGSISHSKGLVCAVAGGDALQFLGLDLEKTNRLSPAAMLKVLHPSERIAWGMDRRMASLVFSVKEAFYKAQYPVFRAQPGFHDLAFFLDPNVEGALVAEVLAEDWSAELRGAAERMQFRFRFVGEYVVTVCWAMRP